MFNSLWMMNQRGVMRLHKLALLHLIILLLFPLLSYAEPIEKIELLRSDGSVLKGYMTCPVNLDSYPIAMIIHGSQCESISAWHEDFTALATQLGVALVTLEKQGIYSQNEINVREYDLTNCIEHRLEDALWFIEKVREGAVIPKWNRQMIMFGGSEGGRVAAAVSAQTPEVMATALYTCGGGLSSIEELTIAFAKYMKSHGESDEEIEETLQVLDGLIQEMLTNPTHEKKFMEYTYKWWASHLSRHTINDLVQIDHPIYYVHGSADAVVPIESADFVAERFKEQGKLDFYYRRLEGYDHDLRTFPPQIMEEMIKMLEDILSAARGDKNRLRLAA